jgi:hypothetical protein
MNDQGSTVPWVHTTLLYLVYSLSFLPFLACLSEFLVGSPSQFMGIPYSIVACLDGTLPSVGMNIILSRDM